MAHWFVIALGDAMFADSKLFRLESQLKEIYEASNEPENMAAFYRHESGGLHCKVFVYLTPSFAEHAARLGAAHCEKPEFTGLSLLVGSFDGF
jgi:hypothetical protein